MLLKMVSEDRIASADTPIRELGLRPQTHAGAAKSVTALLPLGRDHPERGQIWEETPDYQHRANDANRRTAGPRVQVRPPAGSGSSRLH